MEDSHRSRYPEGRGANPSLDVLDPETRSVCFGWNLVDSVMEPSANIRALGWALVE